MNVILIGHGNTAAAMKDAVEMIFGTSPRFFPLPFVPGEGPSDITGKIEAVMTEQDLHGDETLVVTDLFGGSPYNAAATMAMKDQVSDVIAGMSLPMCLILAAVVDTSDVADAVNDVVAQAETFTRVLSVERQKVQEESDF